LPTYWFDFQQYSACQILGNAWLRAGESAVLRVSSAIIADEWNYLLNPAHPDFQRIQLTRSDSFIFDPRIKR
jgi:RES domain-containing protein